MPDYSVSVYEREGSPYWWARCFIAGEGGRKRRWTTGIPIGTDRRKSRRLAQRRAEEQAKSRVDALAASEAPTKGNSLESAGKRLLRQKMADGRRDQAVKSLGWIIGRRVLPFFGKHRDVTTIHRSDLEAFKRNLRAQGFQPTSINNSLTGIRQILKYACEVEELIESVPFVKNVPVSQESKGRALSPKEFDALIRNLDKRAVEARHFLLFLGNTGLRKSEALAIRWGWIDWKERLLFIPAEFYKGARARKHPVSLNAVAYAVLKERFDHGRKRIGGGRTVKLPTKDEDRVFLQLKHDAARNSAAIRAKLGPVRNHDLRHTFSSLAQSKGATHTEAADLLGHHTLAMVRRYSHSFPERLRKMTAEVNLGADFVVSDAVSTKRSKTPRSGRK